MGAHRTLPDGRTLNAVMDFDHVIQVHEDGTVTDGPSEVYAPDLYAETVSDGWELMNGYSGQYGYSGPVMHPSEFIGGRMADDILTTPGVYVAVIADGDEEDSDGWAVARKL